MNIQDKLNNWNKQIEQAQEYGIFFDWYTVKEMIDTIEDQKKKIERMEAELRIIDLFGWK